MSDRELLEKAAKAAGIDGVYDPTYEAIIVRRDHDGIARAAWNPLTDDGDALRLAVKLRLNIDFGTHESLPYVCAERPGIEMVRGPVNAIEDSYEQEITNWNAATRRAIVRAAAAVGETMKEQKR